MCKLQCVEVHTLLKKITVGLLKNDKVQPWFFLTKYKFQHTVIYTFFSPTPLLFEQFFLLVSSYVLKLYPHVIGMDK